jgi:hypothetical protein
MYDSLLITGTRWASTDRVKQLSAKHFWTTCHLVLELQYADCCAAAQAAEAAPQGASAEDQEVSSNQGGGDNGNADHDPPRYVPLVMGTGMRETLNRCNECVSQFSPLRSSLHVH